MIFLLYNSGEGATFLSYSGGGEFLRDFLDFSMSFKSSSYFFNN